MSTWYRVRSENLGTKTQRMMRIEAMKEATRPETAKARTVNSKSATKEGNDQQGTLTEYRRTPTGMFFLSPIFYALQKHKWFSQNNKKNSSIFIFYSAFIRVNSKQLTNS